MRRSVRCLSGTAASWVSPPMLVLQLSGSCRSQNRSMWRHSAAWSLDLTGGYLVGPYSEARQCVGTERVAERDVGGVAATRDQHPADARRVVARVEGMPLPAEEHLEPGSEIHRIVHRRHTDVTEVSRAVARRDVHAATEGNGKMREITADAGSVVKSFQRRPGHACVLVAERDMSVNVVADCLHAAPSRWRLPKEIPRRIRQPIGFAIPAPEQEDKRFLGQVRHGNLLRLGSDDVGDASIVDERIGPDARAALRRNNAGAPVAEAVTIGSPRDWRVDHQVVTADEIGHAGEVDVEVEYHRGGLRAVVDHFEANVNLHYFSPVSDR